MNQPNLSLDRLDLNKPQVVDSPPAGRLKWKPRPATSNDEDDAKTDESDTEDAVPPPRRKHPLED